jgi:cell division protein FtsB
MMRFLNNNYTFLIVIGFILFILLYSFFGERGLRRVFILKKELKEIESDCQNLRAENDVLKETVYLLKNDKKYMEKIAREELGLVRSEELIYLFKNN